MKDIVKIIKADMESKQGKYIAREYYNNDINQQQDIILRDDGVVIDRTPKRQKLYTNYFRLLVDQKEEYLLAKPISGKVNNVYKLTEMFSEAVHNGSLDGQSWLYCYMKDNKLEYTFIEDREIIPFYSNYGKELEKLIRYYRISEKQIMVELWTKDSLTKLVIEKDKVISSESFGHYITQELYQDEVIGSYNRYFGKIPFIPFYNNKHKESDLNNIQGLLDVYNSISSGFISNIDDFQEALIKLQGFSGDSEILAETMANMKKYKMIGIPSDGDMEYMKVEIPVEPRRVILELVKDNIFLLGRGVDNSKIGEGNLTNIIIQSRYANLDMKCNGTERELRKFYSRLLDFIGEAETEITFNRSIIINEEEKLKSLTDALPLYQAGLISKETMIQNNPLVNDLEEELKLIQANTLPEGVNRVEPKNADTSDKV